MDWSCRNKIEKWDLVELEPVEQHYPCCNPPWPAKYYACSFCKREFRSAQALGGHMNVHRKDRARLRLLSSWVLDSQNPNNTNSNPNPNPISLSTNFSVYLSPPFITPPSSSVLTYGVGDLSKEKTMTMKPFPGGVDNNMKRGLQQDSKEVLDLELRLGYL